MSKRVVSLQVLVLLIVSLALCTCSALAQAPDVWKADSVPVQSHITGGPWTLQRLTALLQPIGRRLEMQVVGELAERGQIVGSRVARGDRYRPG